MELELSKSYGAFKNFVGLLKAVLEEVTLEVSAEGIHVRAMDPSHVAMIDATVKPDLFDVFNSPTAENVTINIAELIKFLDRIDEKEEGVTVKISLGRENGKLAILVKKGRYRRTFSMSLLERGEGEEVPSPKILFKAYAKIITDSFRRGIKDAMLVSEHVKLVCTKEAFTLSALGDMGNIESCWEKGSDDLLDLKVEEDASATFTLSFLDGFMNAIRNVADILEVELSTDMPYRIRGTASNIEIAYYLAPCIGV